MVDEPLSILSDDVSSVEARGPDLSDDALRELYDALLLCRCVDERAAALHREGEIGFWVPSTGNEAAVVGAARALEDGDWLFPSYRDRGMFLLRGGSLQGLFDQAFGNADDACRGRQLPGHPSLDGGRYVAPSGPVGSQILHAAGCALGMRLRGDPAVAMASFGAGAADQGDFHTGLALVARRQAPAIFLCQSAGAGPGAPERPVVERAAGHPVDRKRVDGGDVLAVLQAVAEARAQAVAGGRPTLVEAVLPRTGVPGSKGPAPAGQAADREGAEPDAAPPGTDPLERLRTYLDERGAWTPAWQEERDARARERIDAAVDQARQTGPPPGASLFDDVWATPPSEVRRQRAVLVGDGVDDDDDHGTDEHAGEATGGETGRGDSGASGTRGSATTLLEAVRTGLRAEMERDDRIVLLGEDVATSGGPFGVTEGFLEAFGEDRVVPMPLADGGALGTVVGMAAYGLRPVLELSFADALGPGFDQIASEMARLRYRSGGQYACPVVVRAPVGAGLGGGPDQSLEPEGRLAGVPGLAVVAPSSPADAVGLLRTALRGAEPVVMLEPQSLYRSAVGELPEDDFIVPLGDARTLRRGEDVTVVAWGGAVAAARDAATAAAERGVDVDLLDLRSLAPVDAAAVLASVRRTGRLVIVHRAPMTGGFGAELAARVAERAILWLEAPIVRVTAPDTPVPRSLERICLPDRDRVLEGIERVADF